MPRIFAASYQKQKLNIVNINGLETSSLRRKKMRASLVQTMPRIFAAFSLLLELGNT